MDIFGDNWTNYVEKIKKNWLNEIHENDLVLLPGDFSWGINLKETYKDFEFLNNLPGKKLLSKGNHDFWWQTKKKLEEFVKENNFKNIDFLYNDSKKYENYIIVGTRGWSFLDTENSEKMLNRELARLEISIKDGTLKKERSTDKFICMMHYPPITKDMINQNIKSPYLELLKKYNIDNCYYAHLHGKSHNDAVQGKIDGINLKLISSDYLDFKPYKIV